MMQLDGKSVAAISTQQEQQREAGAQKTWNSYVTGESADAAAEKAGIGRIGWHTFRHTYSTLLHAYGTDMKVQQELLRHSDIRTTMNIYTHTVSPALREANSKVVRMILPERKTA